MTEGYVLTESEEQQLVFEWSDIARLSDPRLQLLHHIPNGGFRQRATAARLKLEGVKAGVPDICLPVPTGKYHGLYIEMKKRDRSNRPTREQMLWIEMLSDQGYRAVVCYGADEAIDEIIRYLGSDME